MTIDICINNSILKLINCNSAIVLMRYILDKRNREASALRDFFSEQWGYLLNLIEDRQRRSEEELTYNRHLADAVEHIVEKVDARIRGIGSYQNQLRSSAHELLNYIQNIIDELPAAITIDKGSYVREPLINTMFASHNELEGLLNRSDEFLDFTHNHKFDDNRTIYALLFSIREEKAIFGSEITDDLIQRDVQQTAVNFYGHQVVAPALSEQEVRSSLKGILFESVVAHIRSNMVKLRYSQSLEERQQAALNPEQNINNPEVYLRMLVDQLGMPKNIISLQSNTIKVSKMGILLTADSSNSFNELQLHELAIGSDNTQAVALIRLEWDKWLR